MSFQSPSASRSVIAATSQPSPAVARTRSIMPSSALMSTNLRCRRFSIVGSAIPYPPDAGSRGVDTSCPVLDICSRHPAPQASRHPTRLGFAANHRLEDRNLLLVHCEPPDLAVRNGEPQAANGIRRLNQVAAMIDLD